MTPVPCSFCGDTEPSHVHNEEERIDWCFTVGRGQSDLDAAQMWKRRAVAVRSAAVRLADAVEDTYPHDRDVWLALIAVRRAVSEGTDG